MVTMTINASKINDTLEKFGKKMDFFSFYNNAVQSN